MLQDSQRSVYPLRVEQPVRMQEQMEFGSNAQHSIHTLILLRYVLNTGTVEDSQKWFSFVI